MKIEEHLDSFKRIRKVEAPSFLFTRIQERIESVNYASLRWKRTYVVAAIVVCILNVTIVVQSITSRQHNSLENVVLAMHLSTENTLYHE
jgi:hypothetical protein